MLATIEINSFTIFLDCSSPDGAYSTNSKFIASQNSFTKSRAQSTDKPSNSGTQTSLKPGICAEGAFRGTAGSAGSEQDHLPGRVLPAADRAAGDFYPVRYQDGPDRAHPETPGFRGKHSGVCLCPEPHAVRGFLPERVAGDPERAADAPEGIRVDAHRVPGAGPPLLFPEHPDDHLLLYPEEPDPPVPRFCDRLCTVCIPA